MGRDTSVVAAHPAALADHIRAIVRADARPGAQAREVRFSLLADKVFLFRPDTGERIRMERP